MAKVGDKMKVRVIEVDLPRKRIALSAKSGAPQAPAARRDPSAPRPQQNQAARMPAAKPFSNNPFASLLKK